MLWCCCSFSVFHKKAPPPREADIDYTCFPTKVSASHFVANRFLFAVGAQVTNFDEAIDALKIAIKL